MVTTKTVVALTAWSALLVSPALLAGEAYVCQRGTLVRHISIDYANEGMVVPCQVNYTREDGTTQSLWSAQNDEGYCEQKVAEFAERQRGWGWDCIRQAD